MEAAATALAATGWFSVQSTIHGGGGGDAGWEYFADRTSPGSWLARPCWTATSRASAAARRSEACRLDTYKWLFRAESNSWVLASWRIYIYIYIYHGGTCTASSTVYFGKGLEMHVYSPYRTLKYWFLKNFTWKEKIFIWNSMEAIIYNLKFNKNIYIGLLKSYFII